MAEEVVEEVKRHRRRRRTGKRPSRKRKKVIQEFRWVIGGFLLGLPVLLLLMFLMSYALQWYW